MPFAYRGVTHCSECGKKLKIGELAICKECENKEKEISEKIKTHGNSMTEEEAIEYLREISIDITGVHIEEAKEIILNLIDKLKKENKELKEKVIKRDNELIDLEEYDEKYLITKEEVAENYILKDKIRKKIEPKLNKLKEEMNKEFDMYGKSSEYLNLDEQYDFLYEIKELLGGLQ